ncbi:hypothetical protein STRTUCAR8_00700 [Streptomyces turgidiscabies Car8]|uniref:Uncharacterized protein n=1 Tax=Streptomyces turgidiscabies (strain Car8) TaxID=698760 RepID=L7EZ11_STRT8|nr:hypothetical protein STRTUCAR8_00700 [Streptomyces turgidiscabies Car8]
MSERVRSRCAAGVRDVSELVGASGPAGPDEPRKDVERP